MAEQVAWPGYPPGGGVAYIDVHVYYLRSLTLRFGESARTPVVVTINGNVVRLGREGGRVPVAAGVPLRIGSTSFLRSFVQVCLQPGQVVPVYYSENFSSRTDTVTLSLTPFTSVPGKTLFWVLFVCVFLIPAIQGLLLLATIRGFDHGLP